MEVHLTLEQASRLEQLANDRGRDIHSLAQEAISRYLEGETRFVEAVKLGESQLHRGEYLSHEAVGTRIEQMLKS